MKVVVDVNDNTAGVIEVNQTALPVYPATLPVREGTFLHLKANPNNGYQFSGWGGDLDSYKNPIRVSIDSNTNIVANFSEITHNLEIGINGNGTCDPLEGVHTYRVDNRIEVSAIADRGWEFDTWIGDVIDPDSVTTTVIMDSDKKIEANYSQIIHELTIESIGGGTTIPQLDIYSYAEGTEVLITANPDDGWTFDGWSGDVADANSVSTRVLIDTDKKVTANFSQVLFTTGRIGTIAGATAAGLIAFFLTKRRRSRLSRIAAK